jgi:hypothetical protein
MKIKHLFRSLIFPISLCIVLTLLSTITASFAFERNVGIPSPTSIQVVKMNLPRQIFKRWIHSREEDQESILVYRSDDYPFPPARGREGLEFRENGEFIQYRIGAADVNLAVPGRWSTQETSVIEIQLSNQSATSYTLRILECDEQILKVSKTN